MGLELRRKGHLAGASAFSRCPCAGPLHGSRARKADGERKSGAAGGGMARLHRAPREDPNSRLCKAGQQALEIVSNGSLLDDPNPYPLRLRPRHHLSPQLGAVSGAESLAQLMTQLRVILSTDQTALLPCSGAKPLPTTLVSGLFLSSLFSSPKNRLCLFTRHPQE